MKPYQISLILLGIAVAWIAISIFMGAQITKVPLFNIYCIAVGMYNTVIFTRWIILRIRNRDQDAQTHDENKLNQNIESPTSPLSSPEPSVQRAILQPTQSTAETSSPQSQPMPVPQPSPAPSITSNSTLGAPVQTKIPKEKLDAKKWKLGIAIPLLALVVMGAMTIDIVVSQARAPEESSLSESRIASYEEEARYSRASEAQRYTFLPYELSFGER